MTHQLFLSRSDRYLRNRENCSLAIMFGGGIINAKLITAVRGEKALFRHRPRGGVVLVYY